MDRLVSVVGPAPSGLLWEEWLERLRGERGRVQGELMAFREGRLMGWKGKRRKVKASTKVKKKTKVEEAERKARRKLLAEIGLTEEEYQEMMKGKERGKG